MITIPAHNNNLTGYHKHIDKTDNLCYLDNMAKRLVVEFHKQEDYEKLKKFKAQLALQEQTASSWFREKIEEMIGQADGKEPLTLPVSQSHIDTAKKVLDESKKSAKKTAPKSSGKTINPDNQCKCGQMKIAGKCPKCKK